VAYDYDSQVTIFTRYGQRIQGVNYNAANYPLGPKHSDESFEGAKQWFRLASWPFTMQASWTRQMDPIGWLWTTPYKVKRYLVGRGDYVAFYGDGREITFMEAIHH
jgi:hypothetical protein